MTASIEFISLQIEMHAQNAAWHAKRARLATGAEREVHLLEAASEAEKAEATARYVYREVVALKAPRTNGD